MARGLIFVLLGTLLAGCSRSPSPPDTELLPAAATTQAANGAAHFRTPAVQRTSHGPNRATTPSNDGGQAPVATEATECRAAGAERIVAIGDLHGDLKATRRALQLAGAIDKNDRWVGGKLVVVQTGDMIDRGDDDRSVLALLEKEHQAAKKVGGAVYRLNGNHEVMNVQADFRYVTEKALEAYASEPRSGRPDVAQLPREQQGRAEAFSPGGREARKLAALPAVWMVGDTVFAHGGVEPRHVAYGLDRINRELGAWMRGDARLPNALAGDSAPFWTRTYGVAPASERTCALLGEVLASLGAARMVVGHTPQKGGVTFDCDRRLARIDVGLSAYYGDNPTEVLEIRGTEMRVLKEQPTARAE